MREEWKGFKEGAWTKEINVSDFIKTNYKEYVGDESFLEGTTEKTNRVWGKCSDLLKEELKKHVLDIDVDHMSGINAFKPGYISKDDDVIVGLQTDAPLKRIVNPYGGIRMVYQELDAYGYKLNPEVDKYFNEYRKTHNQGVFDAYTPEIRKARHVGLLTGLPDAYGRGRIIGDYRRVALYGIDYLMEQKKDEWDNKLLGPMTNDLIELREEVSMQYRALDEIKQMAKGYGFDISRPARNGKEAVQWTYFGYLASVKENNGAAMSLGRVDAFFDIYFERDLNDGTITEKEIQEIIDQFVIKLRLVRHLRTPDYDELFSGDPTWVTASIGGVTTEGKSMVTKTSYRILHTLTNLDTAPEPNMTVLWAQDLPENFKKYCAKMSIETDAIQYENDDVMRPVYGDDYAIACCVSAMREGKDMQFFGARCNLAKALLYAINGGVDEVKGDKVIEGFPKMTDEVLDYDKVKDAYFKMIEKVAEVYSNAMNIIHYMHDKYAYEAGQMALHDTNVNRLMAYGVAGLSVATDSLSAIKYAKVKPIRNEDGIAIDFEVEGDYPKYGNDDDRVDNIAKEILDKMYKELSKHKCYRNATPTLSVLTITSNVVYGSKTGSTPDGRKAGEAFAPGANPMHGRDSSGAIASLNSVAKLNYADCCRDGISNTFSIVPNSLGHSKDEQIDNLVSLLDGYFVQGAHHLNVNVLQREMLIDAMNNPDKYPLLTIRVSGYAVRFNRLTRKQQEEVISRTFHEKM
ncbi:MAG TPA: formate C-acetyltransferase [Candidatus Onthousia faecipullorum]|uniref:Formate acetyltransferase n=1 Tax=Candidatus Onthousia faecipullorum TaxID=2840887 RepID=A0A9D1GB83_9FIRM|nr:formate C-acetyltransferase [Candidatus Onthousia faecipullorum]